jgi:hypothetical protein
MTQAMKPYQEPPDFPSLPSLSAITPASMLSQAVSSGASIEVIERLAGLLERWEGNQARKTYEKALTLAKSEIGPIRKNKTVSHGAGKANFKHADLAEIDRTITPILAKHGLKFRWRTKAEGDLIVVTCLISHDDGYFEENSLPGKPDVGQARNALQAGGSTVTYLQRYTLMAALGLSASDDDDGAAAGRPAETIDADQVETMRAKLELTAAGIAGFLKWAKLERLEDVLAKDYDHFTRQIEGAARK